jgi:hypothetical protein
VNSPENGQNADPWGRVAEDGTGFVRTAEGERPVGQWPDGDPDEALRFFKKRFDALDFEVGLLEQRVRGGALGPDEATSAVKQVRAAVAEAQAVGDLGALLARLDALTGAISERREQRRAERARQVVEG